MARSLKPQKVDTIDVPKYRRQVDLMLDRNRLVFYGVVDGERHEHRDAEEAKKLIRRAVEAAGPGLEWRPYLTVHAIVPQGHFSSDSVGFEAERFYAARTAQGTILRATWDIQEEERLTYATTPNAWYVSLLADQVSLPATESLHSWQVREEWRPTHAIHAYDESLWALCEAIREGIQRLQRKLHELVQPNAFAALAAQGSPPLQLSAGDPADQASQPRPP